jgi:hypothetical protein
MGQVLRAAGPKPRTVAGPGPLPPAEPPMPEYRRDEEGDGEGESGLTQWPEGGGLDENDRMLMRRTPGGKFPTPVLPSTLLPAHFKHARQTAWGTPLGKTIPADQKASGRFGLEFDLKKRRNQRKLASTAMISASAADEPNVYAHELGHVAYEFDVPTATKQNFQRMTNKVIQDLIHDLQEHGPLSRDPIEREAEWGRLTARYPRAITFNYLQFLENARKQPSATKAHRAALYHEAFSELFGQYMTNPSAFRAAFPGFYDYYRNPVFKGTEYVGGKPVRAPQSARSPRPPR